jgi:hypothetical protein
VRTGAHYSTIVSSMLLGVSYQLLREFAIEEIISYESLDARKGEI